MKNTENMFSVLSKHLLSIIYNWFIMKYKQEWYFDSLVQDCSISIADELEILQSCTKPSICKMPNLETKHNVFIELNLLFSV